MKIHIVKLHSLDSGGLERTFLVRAHTRAGAERHVQRKVGRFITATVPSQQELVDALAAKLPIEDATGKGPNSDHRPPSPDDQQNPSTDSE